MNTLLSLFLIVLSSFSFVAHVDYSRKDIPLYKHKYSSQPFCTARIINADRDSIETVTIDKKSKSRYHVTISILAYNSNTCDYDSIVDSYNGWIDRMDCGIFLATNCARGDHDSRGVLLYDFPNFNSKCVWINEEEMESIDYAPLLDFIIDEKGDEWCKVRINLINGNYFEGWTTCICRNLLGC